MIHCTLIGQGKDIQGLGPGVGIVFKMLLDRGPCHDPAHLDIHVHGQHGSSQISARFLARQQQLSPLDLTQGNSLFFNHCPGKVAPTKQHKHYHAGQIEYHQ